MIDKYLKETCMLDYSNPEIQELIQKKQWKELDEFESKLRNSQDRDIRS